MRIDSTGAQPTILSCAEVNFTSISLTSGKYLQQYYMDRSHLINAMLKCSGNDYYVLESQSELYPGQYNISILNAETGGFTPKASFYIPEQPRIIWQSNSIDLQNGLAFATYCPSNTSYLSIFNMNTETVETIESSSYCQLYALGAYDSANQLYYLYGFNTGTLKALSFGVYSMITKSFTYHDIPFEMQHWSYVQSVFVYQSTVYVGLFQNSYYQLITVDCDTKTTRSIFKADYFPFEQYTLDFVFDSNGYIVIIAKNPPNYSIFTIDLQTEQYTNHTIPNIAAELAVNFESNSCCAQ
ncbi:hypothetical protein PPL_11169 [Heterostelium album PN500]|uniref:Uncharacterized protein n=1 Tax=Heterostelium pallidum (strain ATCC 26659 / Pp 5 / PN500) TaxID=670386 RepID=D3BTQ9_HETP5|nr:hypothetical protein PPL_11169 [Heterostelium album PN500]EFA75095.1 hypothetical protein PPL_11169 [Heterostelium album PN500]|eukprot:XP_020427229.1 hypothetical protein PPL_11169 [Heterostelium album PN500]